MNTLTMLAAMLGSLSAAPAPGANEAIPPTIYQGKQFTGEATVAGKPRTFLLETGEGPIMIGARPVARLPLVQYGRGIAAKVEIGGRERLFQVDTAGGTTVVTPAIAKAIGCVPWGRIVGFHMRGARISGPRCDDVRLRWHGHDLRAPAALVLDVGRPDAPLDGSLALDAFAGRTVTIDFARLELTVESLGSAAERIRGATEVKANLAREVGGLAVSAFVQLPARHGPLRLELDSGNTGPNLISRPLLGEVGLDPVAGGGQAATLPLADGVAVIGPIYGPDLMIDGNLGMSFLKNWKVTLDLSAGRVWLRRSAVPPPRGLGDLPPPPPATSGLTDASAARK